MVGYDATVTEARLHLFNNLNANGNAVGMQINRVRKDWTSAISWNKYDTTNSWAIPGGDYDDYTTKYIGAAGAQWIGGGTAGSYTDFYPTALVADWVSGSIPNYGFAVRATSQSNNMLNYRSSEHTTVAEQPQLRVTYKARLGQRSAYTLDTHNLTDRANVGVNVANANVVVANNDLTVRGTGLNLAVQRLYNNFSPDHQWYWSVGADVHLEVSGDGSVTYHAADGARYPFLKSTTGTFTAPPGMSATITNNGSGNWTLKYNGSREQLKFSTIASDPVLKQDIDRNNNIITYAYNLTAGNAEISTATDTQSRVTNFTWTSGQLTKITDSTGRHVDYGYTGTNLTAATDLAGKTTSYGYDTFPRLTTITTPRGNVTTLGYTGLDMRVTSLSQVDGANTYTTGYNLTTSTPGLGSTELVDANGNKTVYSWDVRDRVTKTKDANLNFRSTAYTPNDDAMTFTDALSAISDVGHDTNNNLTSLTSPKNGSGSAAISNLSYNAPGGNTYQPSSSTNAQSKCSSYRYDTNGNPTDTYAGITATGTGTTRQCDTGRDCRARR